MARWMAGVLVPLLLAGCIGTDVVRCASGRVCPAAYVCDEFGGGCFSPGQIVACAGANPGDACTTSGAAGECVRGGCMPFACGDDVRNGAEQCDGADLGGADCTDFGFYDAPGLTCDRDCTHDRTGCTGRCGDGVRNGDEACDGDDEPDEADGAPSEADAGGRPETWDQSN